MDVKTYLTESARTASGGYHTENMGGDLSAAQMLASIQLVGAGADNVKRKLYYNKVRSNEALQNMFVEADASATRPVTFDMLDKDIIHALLGMVSECGEIAEAINTTEDLDMVNLREEAGDILWYMAMLLRALGTDFETEMERNINKLRVRFPDKFTTEKAADRDLDAERQALEA